MFESEYGADKPLISPVPDEVLDRARSYRLERMREQMSRMDVAALLLYDPVNIRYAFDSSNMQVWTAHNPTRYALILADGPTGNLDEETGAQISQLLFSKQKERGMTLVLVTHDPNLARQCDRTLRVRAGEIEGPAEAPAKNRKKSAA